MAQDQTVQPKVNSFDAPPQEDDSTGEGDKPNEREKGRGFAKTAPPKVKINDARFIRDLNRLKQLRSFLIQEAIPLSADDSRALRFGALNLLKYDSFGREPTMEEWSEVENLTQALFRLLTDPLRRRFLLGEIPGWLSYQPLFLALVAVGALVWPTTFHSAAPTWLSGMGMLPFYVVWLMCLGAIGSAAFIGMNALSVQQDVTFDLSNQKLMALRIVLGALFGLVLTLPFGFEEFEQFIISIRRVPADGIISQPIGHFTSEAFLLLLPFILGFSTSVVIMVLNRLVDGVQAFFGRPNEGARQSASTVPDSALAKDSAKLATAPAQ